MIRRTQGTVGGGDGVIVFERGDLLFVFNFHPCASYDGYQLGSCWNEPMRTILDTDEVPMGSGWWLVGLPQGRYGRVG
eukprot:Skav213299  [mRNA]  locus=scaffold2480:546589:549497:- [translate_table: standard]